MERLCTRIFRAISVLSLFAAIAAFLTLTAFPRAALADTEKRVALVIGNGDYKTAPRLENPPIDARAVAASLKRLGFQVIEGYDQTIGQMRASVAEFSTALRDAKAAIVYYAGHGVSVDDENYLIPTDIVLKSPTDLDLNAISVSLILRQMKREDRVNVVILDACRENPFAADLAYAGSRSMVGARGLSAIEGDLARGTLIAFASDPKAIALDGFPGEHSPFTKALIDHLEDPGVSIDTVMNRVRSEVWEATKNKQLPWVNTSIIGEFSLNPQAPPTASAGPGAPTASSAPAAPAADKVAQENLLWESAQRSNLSGDYRAYLDAYPTGVYAPMARNRIASLTSASEPSTGSARDTQAPKPDQSARENLLWESAERSNLPADYKAYLDAYPTGVFAPMARNRIASLSNAPEPPAGRVVPLAPQTPSFAVPAALGGEVGTMETESALNLGPAQIRELQQRLTALALNAGPATGALDEQTRSAIGEWQKRHGLPSTSWLGPLQLAALRAESEAAYQQLLMAAPQAVIAPPVGPYMAPRYFGPMRHAFYGRRWRR
ncbi:MAG: caspase family protein [Roseiarcus sp.]